MKKLYHIYNEKFEITHAQFFEEGEQTENSIFIENCDFIKPMVNPETLEVYEGLTSEEIAQLEQEKRIAEAKSFIENNQKEGESFYDDIHLRVTVALFAVDRNILFPILDEIDNKLYPPLNKIKTGDFASALYIFANQQAPTNEFVLDFYNEVVMFCQDYYDTKYPK